ncbi:hypothetical protein [Streptomyces iconiensis]|uniref:Carrier domain-containing protein n=1 Tax=Streptomyces iconiensis TaxID=1384038 RepID=A0ABT7A021_9ACTN|nr:hypothetical protein [Streptomyces iconiensis]MDJ1133993.1 hypothetical protein [Streptomyces iconiensis]
MLDGAFVTDHMRALAVHLVAVKPNLRMEEIAPDASLTDDLGFDSMNLEALGRRIREAYPDFDLMHWLDQTFSSESDSVGSMAESLAACESAPLPRAHTVPYV